MQTYFTRFRVYDLTKREYTDQNRIMTLDCNGQLWEIVKNSMYGELLDRKRYIVELKMGTRDRNNCYIYEGSVVKRYKGDAELPGLFDVMFNGIYFYLRQIDNPDNVVCDLEDLEFEVVDNIHEVY